MCLQSISPQPQPQPSTARGVPGDWAALLRPQSLGHIRPGRGGGRGGGRRAGGAAQLLHQRPTALVLHGGREQVNRLAGSITSSNNRLSLSSFNHRVFQILLSFIFSSQLIVIEEEELEEVSIDTDSVSTSSSSVKLYLSHISHFYCLIFLLLVFHKCEHLLF